MVSDIKTRASFEFVKSLQSGNFQCYLETLKLITSWMFSVDQRNYTRWLPTLLTQMIHVNEKHLTLYGKLITGSLPSEK